MSERTPFRFDDIDENSCEENRCLNETNYINLFCFPDYYYSKLSAFKFVSLLDRNNWNTFDVLLISTREPLYTLKRLLKIAINQSINQSINHVINVFLYLAYFYI